MLFSSWPTNQSTTRLAPTCSNSRIWLAERHWPSSANTLKSNPSGSRPVSFAITLTRFTPSANSSTLWTTGSQPSPHSATRLSARGLLTLPIRIGGGGFLWGVWVGPSPGEAPSRGKVHVATVILVNIVPPQYLHGGDVILDLAPAMFEVATEDGRFLRVPSCTDAKQETAAARIVEAGHLLGSKNRIAFGDQTDAGPKLDAAG